MGRREGRFVGKHAPGEGSGHVEDVGLTHRRCPEPGAGARPERKRIAELPARSDLAVVGFADVLVVLVPTGNGDREGLECLDLHVHVGRSARSTELPGQPRPEAGEAVGADAKALLGQATGAVVNVPRVFLAAFHLELLSAQLEPDREVDRRKEQVCVQRPQQIQVQRCVGFRVGARSVVGGDVLALARRKLGEQLRVDGVLHQEVHVVAANHRTEVEAPVLRQAPTNAHGTAGVGDGATEAGREPAGKRGDEREAVRICLHRRDVARIRHVAHDPNGRTVARYTVRRQIRNLHRVVGRAVNRHRVAPEDAVAGVRIPIVEAPLNLSFGKVAEGVGLPTLAEIDAEVAEQLEIVVNLWRAPNHHVGMEHVTVVLVRDVAVAGAKQRQGVVSLLRAVCAPGRPVFEAEVGETRFRERQSDVGSDVGGLAVAFVEPAPANVHLSTVPVVPELEVDDAGDGVGAVLRSRSVSQHFHPLECDGWYDRDVGAMRTVGDAIAQEGDDARAMSALAVHQRQGCVGRQPPQTGRPHQRGGVVDGLLVHVVRRDDVGQQGVHVGRSLPVDFRTVDDVHRHERLRGRAPFRPTRTDDDDFLLDLHPIGGTNGRRHGDSGPDAEQQQANPGCRCPDQHTTTKTTGFHGYLNFAAGGVEARVTARRAPSSSCSACPTRRCVGRAVELDQHGVVHIAPECALHGFEVRPVAVRGELHPILASRPRRSSIRSMAVAVAHPPCRNELGVRVNRHPRPHVASFGGRGVGAGNVLGLRVDEAPSLVNLNAPARQVVARPNGLVGEVRGGGGGRFPSRPPLGYREALSDCHLAAAVLCAISLRRPRHRRYRPRSYRRRSCWRRVRGRHWPCPMVVHRVVGNLGRWSCPRWPLQAGSRRVVVFRHTGWTPFHAGQITTCLATGEHDGSGFMIQQFSFWFCRVTVGCFHWFCGGLIRFWRRVGEVREAEPQVRLWRAGS